MGSGGVEIVMVHVHVFDDICILFMIYRVGAFAQWQ
jgi:hypothetical protein